MYDIVCLYVCETKEINTLPDLVREMFLKRAVVHLYKSLNKTISRPEPVIYEMLCCVCGYWWQTIARRPGYKRNVRRTLDGEYICDPLNFINTFFVSRHLRGESTDNNSFSGISRTGVVRPFALCLVLYHICDVIRRCIVRLFPVPHQDYRNVACI
jgi:hypothetical protein